MRAFEKSLMVVGLALASAFAAAAEPAAAAVKLNIPTQPIGDALNDFARQSGLQVVMQPKDGADITAPSVVGVYTLDDGLRQLLANTGLNYKYLNERTVAVSVAKAEPPTSQAQEQIAVQDASFWERFQIAQVSESAPNDSTEETSGAAAETELLQEITVTAQKRQQNLKDVPISISVLSGDDLDNSNFQGVSEALKSVPGIATAETYLGSGTNIAIRGVGASFPLFTGPSAVAYYLDSVPFGLVKSAIGPDADVYDLERVEVLRGPQGTLYGSSALNGVVRILTHDPELNEFYVKGRVSASSTSQGAENYRGNATVNFPIVPDKFAGRATVGYQRAAGWIDRPNRADANDMDTQTYRLKINGHVTDKLSVGLFGWLSRSDSDMPNLGHDYKENASLLEQPTRTDYDAYGLKLGYDLPWFSISSMTSQLDYENIGTLGLDVPGFGIPGSIYFSQMQSEVTSEEINLTSSLQGPWRWSAGLMLRRGTEDLVQTFTVIPLPRIHYVNKSESYAVYGELTRLFFDNRLELTAGLRHFREDQKQRGQTAPDTPYLLASSESRANTPRALITWHATDQLMVYTSYSRGFRGGFPQTAVVLQAVPEFPDVKPDLLKNYEVGAKGTLLNGRIGFDAALYHMDWQDIQLLLAIPINNVPNPGVVNGAHARGNGIDLSLTFNPAQSLSISPYISWNDLEISSDVVTGSDILYTKGDRPSGSPETTLGISGDYSFAIGARRARLSASANYISSQAYRSIAGPGAPLLIQASDSVLTSRASFAVDVSSQWTAMIFGENLNNEKGTTAVMFPGVVPDWNSRLRPRTIGLQFEFRPR